MAFVGSLCCAVLLCAGGSENCITNNGLIYQVRGVSRNALVLGRVKSIDDRAIKLCIPSEVKGCNVIGVKNDAFLGDVRLVSVQMEDGIWQIGDRAFKGCSGLEKLDLPDSLIVLGHEAFEDCGKITEVRLPSRLSDHSGSWAFRGCDRLRRVVLSDGLSCDIVPFFCGCAGVEEFIVGTNQYYRVIDECLYSGSGSIFIRCPNKSTISNVCVRAGVKYIADYAFYGCRKLRHVKLPDSISEIGTAAFCMSGIEELMLPIGIDRLYMEVFAGCTNLQSISMPRGIKYIGENCFAGTKELRQIIFNGDKPEIENERDCIGAESCVVVVPIDAQGWAGTNMVWGHPIMPRRIHAESGLLHIK